MSQKFTPEMIKQLKSEWNKIEKIDPSQPAYKKLIAFLDKLPQEMLKQLSDADVKFVSLLAKNRLKENVNESSDKHYSDLITKELEQLGWKKTSTKLEKTFSKIAPSGQLSDGSRKATVEWDSKGRYLTLQNGWEDADMDMRDFMDKPKEGAKKFDDFVKKTLSSVKKESLEENTKFDVEYANKIFDGGDSKRLSHHLFDVSKESLIAIKKEFDKDPKKKKMFDKATKGMSPNDLKESSELNEASVVSKDSLGKEHLDLLKEMNISKDNIKTVYDGIHGIIITVKINSLMVEHRLYRETMEKLLKHKTFRWVCADSDASTMDFGVEHKIKKAEKTISSISTSEIKDAIKSIEHLTDINHHDEALMVLAKLIGDEESQKEINSIIKNMLKVGYQTPETKKAGNKVYKTLMANTEAKFGSVIANKIREAF